MQKNDLRLQQKRGCCFQIEELPAKVEVRGQLQQPNVVDLL